MDKVILHVDLNNFYASVECIANPQYANIPIAVCGNPDLRHGIILAKNNLAKALGVQTGEAIWQAKTKCQNLTVVSPHFEQYAKYSKIVRRIYYDFTDRIETFGLDECWLDVTGSQKLFGSGKEIADKIRQEVKSKTGLTVSVGVAFSKVFAKLGSDMKKPDATTVITRENYKTLVWRLPVGELLFIGKKTQKKLASLNIFTIGDLANAPLYILTEHFGVLGKRMKEDANGEGGEEILKFDEHTPIKSVGNGTTTKRDMESNEDVRTVIYFLAETVASRLRGYGYLANGISINIRNNKLESFSRQHVLSSPTCDSDQIAKACYSCFLENYHFPQDLPIRTLTICAFNLISDCEKYQSSLFEDEINEEKKNLGKSLDKIREKFGFVAVTKAAFIDNSLVGMTHNQDDDTIPFQRNNRN